MSSIELTAGARSSNEFLMYIARYAPWHLSDASRCFCSRIAAMGTHDGSYKLFFSHPRMVQDLLTGFVRAPWVTKLDFSSLQQIGTPGITQDLRRRESDVIWRVRWEHEQHSRFVYLLIEFQSRPDHFMALRLQTYVALLHENMVRNTQLTREGKLPPVLPLVLYNGERRWNAPEETGELVADLPRELRQYTPQLSYCLIDEMALSEQQIPGAGNLVGTLIRLERCHGKNDLLPLVVQLEQELRSPEHKIMFAAAVNSEAIAAALDSNAYRT